MSPARKIGLVLGAALFLSVLLCSGLAPARPLAVRMAAVALLMAAWWITDAIPLFATALLPLVLFPLLGILPGRETAPLYINSTIFLFLGGFMIALAMQRWGLHRRIALVIIRLIGGGPRRLILGQNGRTYDIDSRPSDAVALAMQKGAPIFVEEEVLVQASKHY